MTLGLGHRSNIIKFRLPCQFQRFLYQILFVFSQMKDTKHISQNISEGFFILLPGSCPRGGTFGHWGYPGGQTIFFFKHGHVAYQIDGDDEQNKMQVTFSS